MLWLRLRRIVLRGLRFAPQLVLKVVVTSCANVEQNHTRLLSLRLILVEDRARYRQVSL
jgi:hypothetical protein